MARSHTRSPRSGWRHRPRGCWTCGLTLWRASPPSGILRRTNGRSEAPQWNLLCLNVKRFHHPRVTSWLVYWNNLSGYIEANKCLVNLKGSFYWAWNMFVVVVEGRALSDTGWCIGGERECFQVQPAAAGHSSEPCGSEADPSSSRGSVT